MYKIVKDAIDDYSLDEITFVGDSLSFKPYHTKAQEGYYVRFVLQNGLQIMYKYNDDTNILEPYLYTKGKEIIYANSTAKSEYTNKEKSDVDEPSWFMKFWNSLFSSGNDDIIDNADQKKNESIAEDEESFFGKLWNIIF